MQEESQAAFQRLWVCKGAPAFSQTGHRQEFAENSFGVRVELDLGPWFEHFQLMEQLELMLGQLVLGPVGNLAFSLVWVLKQDLSFLPSDGKPSEQPPTPRSLCSSVLKSCCQGREGQRGSWGIIRAVRSRI